MAQLAREKTKRIQVGSVTLGDQNRVLIQSMCNIKTSNFKKVADSYASDRGNADWAMPIVGHSLAKTYYSQKESLVCLGFYDLDYDFNAKNVHKHFTDAKNSVEISDTNQPITLNGAEGWYLVNTTQCEISFSTKSYVIAVDSEPTGNLSKDDLIQLGKDLKVWN